MKTTTDFLPMGFLLPVILFGKQGIGYWDGWCALQLEFWN